MADIRRGSGFVGEILGEDNSQPRGCRVVHVFALDRQPTRFMPDLCGEEMRAIEVAVDAVRAE